MMMESQLITEDKAATGKMYSVPAIVLSGLSSSMSVCGALVIFATYFVMPEIRNFTRKLVLCLTLADFLTAGGNLVSIINYAAEGNRSNHAQVANDSDTLDLCRVQGTVTAYSTMVSFFLTVCIAVHILATVLTRRDRTGTRSWLVGFNLLSWGIPAVVMTLAVVHNVIGEDRSHDSSSGPWCWIKSGDDNDVDTKLWMWLTVKGWEVACYLLTTTLYLTLKFYLYRRHYKQQFQSIQCSLRDEDQNFLYVWLILYIIRIWGTLRFVLNTYNHALPTKLTNALLYFQAFGDPAQAFCNFFLFCIFDNTVRAKLHSICCVRNTSEETDLLVPAQSTATDYSANVDTTIEGRERQTQPNHTV